MRKLSLGLGGMRGRGADHGALYRETTMVASTVGEREAVAGQHFVGQNGEGPQVRCWST